MLRTDLKIGKGKMIAHGAHAAIEGYELVMEKNPLIVKEWIKEGQKKIVLKVRTEEELTKLYEKVRRKIPSKLVRDAGLTQVKPGTIVCLVIGPWYEEEIDKYTKDLKLL